MGVEAGVLNGYNGVAQMTRYPVDRDDLPVLLLAERRDEGSICREDLGALVLGRQSRSLDLLAPRASSRDQDETKG
jgi:hypothetical protein